MGFWHVKMLNVVFYHMNVVFMDLTTLVLICTMFENWKVFVFNLSRFPSHVATRENIEGPRQVLHPHGDLVVTMKTTPWPWVGARSPRHIMDFWGPKALLNFSNGSGF